MAKIITVAQQKGGAGKTTLAAHIAVALSQKGNRVAVLDIDPQGSLSHWHRIREEKLGEGYTGVSFAALSGWRIGSADLLIVPVQPSPTDLWATKATLDLAKAEKVPVKVVLNRVAAHSKLAAQIAAELPELAKTTLGNRVLFPSSLMEGRTATELEPSSIAAQEIKALVGEILAMVADEDPVEEKKTGKRQLVDA